MEYHTFNWNKEALELAQQQLQDQLSRMRSKASALEAEEARQKLEIRSLNAKLTRLTSTKASNNQLESDIAELQRNHAEAQEEFKSLREQYVSYYSCSVDRMKMARICIQWWFPCFKKLGFIMCISCF